MDTYISYSIVKLCYIKIVTENAVIDTYLVKKTDIRTAYTDILYSSRNLKSRLFQQHPA